MFESSVANRIICETNLLVLTVKSYDKYEKCMNYDLAFAVIIRLLPNDSSKRCIQYIVKNENKDYFF